MSSCSRKINELKERLDGFSGLNDLYIYKNLTKISLIIYEIEKYTKDWDDWWLEDEGNNNRN